LKQIEIFLNDLDKCE